MELQAKDGTTKGWEHSHTYMLITTPVGVSPYILGMVLTESSTGQVSDEVVRLGNQLQILSILSEDFNMPVHASGLGIIKAT